MSALGQLYLVLGQPLEKCAVHAAQDEQLATQFFLKNRIIETQLIDKIR